MTRKPENKGRPNDPFLDEYNDSELRIVSEFLSNWLPFLSKGLCPHCSTLLSHRIHSLSPELNDRKDPSSSGENFSPSTPAIVEKDAENYDTHSLGYWKDEVETIPMSGRKYEHNDWSCSPVAYASVTYSREVDKPGPIPSRSCNCEFNGWSYPPVACASSTYSRGANKVGPIPSRSTNHESNCWSDSPVAYASSAYSRGADKVGSIPSRSTNHEYQSGEVDKVGPIPSRSTNHEYQSGEVDKVGPIPSRSTNHKYQSGEVDKVGPIPLRSTDHESNGWSDSPVAYASVTYSREVDKVSPIERKSPSSRAILTREDIVPKEDNEAEEEKEEIKKHNNATVLNGGSVKTKTEISRDQREYIRFTNVKRKKDFICLERVDGKLTNILKGLELHTGVFSSVEQMRIIDYVYELEKQGRRGDLKERTFTAPRKWMKGKGRITIQFGCCYNYAMDKNGNPPGILKNEEVDPLPSLFKVIIKRLIRWHVLSPSCVPDSCIVNIYEEGDCIPPHIDNHDFVRPFCTVSFLSECNIVFGTDLKIEGPGNFSGSIAIPLPVGSVLVLNGNGADVAKHCVPAVPTKRISLTFRKMDETKRPYFYTPDRDLQGLEPLCYEDKGPKKSPSKHDMNRPAMGGRLGSGEEPRYTAKNQGTKSGRRTRVVLGGK